MQKNTRRGQTTPQERKHDVIKLIHAHAQPRCEHIKTNGTRCKSPAMKNSLYCYFHRQLHEAPSFEAVEIGTLEDANSVQMAIQKIVSAVVRGTIDHKTAGLALYGLQTAAMNLPNCDFEPNHDEVIVDDKGTALEDVECDDDECLDRNIIAAEPVKLVRKGNQDPEARRKRASAQAFLDRLDGICKPREA
jgi:hypothetical protein